jgi:hypothetical protein
VAYDNLVDEGIPELRRDAAKRAQALLEHLDGRLALRDRDSNPEVEGDGRHRVVLGIFYLEQDLGDEGEGS